MKTWNLPFRAVDRDKFEELRSGVKSVETRASGPKYERMQEGDVVVFSCGSDRFERRVKNLRHFPDLETMFAEIPFPKVMPGRAKSVEEAKKPYLTYPGYAERIREYGILAFELE